MTRFCIAPRAYRILITSANSASVAPAPLAALESLLRNVGDGDAVLVTGSLFLIGAVYPFFLARRGQQHLFGTRLTELQP